MDSFIIKSQIINKMPDFSGVIFLDIDGQTVLQEAFGEANISEHIPNKIDTRFAIASGCKAFTAAAILKLAEMGKLSLEDKVCKWLPGSFPSMDNSVTVRHLITHTSGFMDYFDEEYDTDGRYENVWDNIPMYTMRTPGDFIKLLKARRMEFMPGSRFKYNNGGYVILSMLVENASGMNFPDFVQKNIFDPCEMKRSGYFSMDNLPESTAIGYTEDGKGGVKTNIYSVPIIGGGDGGAFTTAKDMHLFWKGLMNGRILSMKMVETMCTPQVSTGENAGTYGYGVWLDICDNEVCKIHLMGADPGVSFRSAYYPQSKAIATVLCNRDAGSFAALKILENNMK